MVETIDEAVYRDGCMPPAPYAVIVRDTTGMKRSDGHYYCPGCRWDMRGRSIQPDNMENPRYHIVRIIEACSDEPVMNIGRKTIGQLRDI